MTAATLSSKRKEDSTSVHGDLIPFSVGGALLGVVTIFLCALIDATVLGFAQYFGGAGITNAAWPDWAVIAFGVFCLAMSVVLGRWLYGLRRWIGLKSEPEDHETAVRKRRHFAVGSMLTYVPLSPVVVLLMIAIASST